MVIRNFINRNWEWLILASVLLFVFCIRLHFLSIPFERDEGEYAYIGQQILKGVPPYESAYNMKFPGIFSFYAIVMFLFGQTIQGIHFGFLLINILSSVLIYLFFSKILNRFIGLFSAALFSLMSLSYVFLGFAGHATHLIVFFIFLGFYLLTFDKLRWYTFLISGMCFSVAVLMKQHAVFLIFPGIVFVAQKIFEVRERNLVKIIKQFSFYIFGLILPIFLVFLSFFVNGIFGKFWFWTMTYASTYVGQASFLSGWNMFKVVIGTFNNGGFYVISIIMFFGIFVVLFSRTVKEINQKRFFLFVFFISSFLTVLPGFYFRGHYFITFLPALALFIGIFFFWMHFFLKRSYLTILLFLIMFLPFFINNFHYFFVFTPNQIIKFTYGRMPFVESKEISQFIEKNTKPEDKIFVFGSEPEVYFYTKKTSASRYIYMYPLMENQPYALYMQKEMITQVEQSRPKYFLFSGERTSWLMNKDSDKYVFSWVKDFLKDYQALIVVDIDSDGTAYELKEDMLKDIDPFGHYLTLYVRLK